LTSLVDKKRLKKYNVHVHYQVLLIFNKNKFNLIVAHRAETDYGLSAGQHAVLPEGKGKFNSMTTTCTLYCTAAVW